MASRTGPPLFEPSCPEGGAAREQPNIQSVVCSLFVPPTVLWDGTSEKLNQESEIGDLIQPRPPA